MQHREEKTFTGLHALAEHAFPGAAEICFHSGGMGTSVTINESDDGPPTCSSASTPRQKTQTPAYGSLLVLLLTAAAGCDASPYGTAAGEAATTSAALAAPAIAASLSASAEPRAAAGASAFVAPPPAPVDPPMVRLPAGTYYQGSAGATGDDFAWQHLESVPAFDLDATEVIVAAYQTCVDAGQCTYALRSPDCNLEREREEYKRDPVNCVTWEEAMKFCAWRGTELPTDGMWEYAAGGRRGQDYPWDPLLHSKLEQQKTRPRPRFLAYRGSCREGASEDERMLPGRSKNAENSTCPVGSAPNGNTLEGVQDMAGNVSEWTQTPFCEHHKKLCKEGLRTVKGSAFNGFGRPNRYHRMSIDEKTWQLNIGFRCARVVKTDPKKGR